MRVSMPRAHQHETLYQAGCGRQWPAPGNAPDLAYTALAFPECPACPHRVTPEGAPPFCTVRPLDRTNPFAALAGLQLPE